MGFPPITEFEQKFNTELYDVERRYIILKGKGVRKIHVKKIMILGNNMTSQ